MTKSAQYRTELAALSEWEPYLRQHSGLPGPRGNLELAQVVAELGSPEFFQRCLAYTPDRAPVNSPDEFLAFCGGLGQGYRLLAGDPAALPALRTCANDPRWRTREAAAMALQIVGDQDFPRLLDICAAWSTGTRLEQRAALAALCEPRLLTSAPHACSVLGILDQVTASLFAAPDRSSQDFKILRQGLAYCWSVAVAALPAYGKPLMEKWLAVPDPDIRWVMQQNLKKSRLSRMDPAWVRRWSTGRVE